MNEALDGRVKGHGRGIVLEDLQYICLNLHDELMQMAPANLLITGGGGFLGYFLVQAVLHWNERMSEGERIWVTVHDNFRRGFPRWLQELMSSNTHLTVMERDSAKPLPREMGDYDYIIHAASIASPAYYRKHPIETMDANVSGLRTLLDYAVGQRRRGQPVRGFLYFSSSEVYGDPDPEHVPTLETYRGNVSFTGPRSCYDESKRYGETLCTAYARVHDIPIKAVRPFNNYGPGQRLDDGRVLPDFVRNVLSEQDILIFSDGNSTRTFCYVADATIGYYKVLVIGRPGEAYNVGVEGPEVAVGDLAERLASIARDLLGYQGKVIYRPSEDREYLVDSPVRRRPSIAKARAELRYNPGIGLDEGLRRSLLWYCDDDSEGARG